MADSKICTCSHAEEDHEPVLDAGGFPSDVEQFCIGGDDCPCEHFEEAELPASQNPRSTQTAE